MQTQGISRGTLIGRFRHTLVTTSQLGSFRARRWEISGRPASSVTSRPFFAGSELAVDVLERSACVACGLRQAARHLPIPRPGRRRLGAMLWTWKKYLGILEYTAEALAVPIVQLRSLGIARLAMEDHQRRAREAVREAIRTARDEAERLRATVEQTNTDRRKSQVDGSPSADQDTAQFEFRKWPLRQSPGNLSSLTLLIDPADVRSGRPLRQVNEQRLPHRSWWGPPSRRRAGSLPRR